MAALTAGLRGHNPRRVGLTRKRVIVQWQRPTDPPIIPASRGFSPPTDVYETEEEIIVRIEVAGVDPSKIEINVDETTLKVSGERPDPGAGHHRIYHQLSIEYGNFLTFVQLPERVDSDQAKARYRDGFLRIALPKRPRPPGPTTVHIE